MTLDRRLLLQQESTRTIRTYAVPNIEIRAGASDDTLTFEGHASVTDYGYDLYGGPETGGWTEIVARGAFGKTLREGPDVQLLVNHDGLPLASTTSTPVTLELDEDQIGLHSVAQLDASDPDVAHVAPKLRKGLLREMSMAFRVTRQRWEELDGTEAADPWCAPVRRILEVSLHKGDVSIVNFGANDAANGGLRSLDRALAELRAGHALDADDLALVREWATELTGGPPAVDPPADPPAVGMSFTLARALASRHAA